MATEIEALRARVIEAAKSMDDMWRRNCTLPQDEAAHLRRAVDALRAAEAARSTFKTTRRMCENCGRCLLEHEDQRYCPPSPNPAREEMGHHKADWVRSVASQATEIRLDLIALASRVAEVERFKELVAMDIAALRRDVDGLKATLETTSAEAIRANVRITKLNIEQRLRDENPTPALAIPVETVEEVRRVLRELGDALECPVCRGSRAEGPHAPDCRLVRAISLLEPAKGGA